MHRESGKVSDLGEALEAYAAHARHRERTTPARAAAYSAAAGAALALAPSADAALQHTDIPDITLTLGSGTPTTQTAKINIDGAYGTDFSFSLFRRIVGATTTTNTLNQRALLVPMNNAIASRTGLFVKRLGPGASIGPGGPEATTAPLLLRTWDDNPGPAGGDFAGSMSLAGAGFIGVAIDRGGETHYGWIRVGVATNAVGAPEALTIYDWAWEDVHDTPITTGLIPEPAPVAGLALLAAGAVGVSAWRRRKMAKG